LKNAVALYLFSSKFQSLELFKINLKSEFYSRKKPIITILFLMKFIKKLKIKNLTFSKRKSEKLRNAEADAAKNRICGCKSEKAWKYGRKSNKNALTGACRTVFATIRNVAFSIRF
jgi:hypothetical protein